MPLKKTAQSKRASLPRNSDCARTFVNDWERLSKAGRYDLNRLKEVMMLLVANDAPLGPEWKDHALTGNLAGYRECHIGGDFLLMHKLEDIGKTSTIVFIRAGTHSELFN